MFSQQTTPTDRVVENRFVLREQIGDGRMSSVYHALDRAAGDVEVAVKILNTSHLDEIKRELFKRETEALKRLHHPNIVRMVHSGWWESEQAFYLVLDWLPYSLDRYLRGELRSQLGSFDQYPVISELANAVVYAHSQGVVHRDIKPSNVLFDANGRPMLTDFGISKLLTRLTVGQTLAAYWSGGYASPEQQTGDPASNSSDIYSLGAVFYHMLSGQEPPAEGPTSLMVDQYVNGPRTLKKVLKRMLEADPSKRPSSGLELLSALEVTRRLELLPKHFLILTMSAIRDIASAGYSSSEDFQEVADVIREDLGGENLDDVHLNTNRRRDQHDIVILGDELRLVCTPDQNGGDALAVKAVHTPYMPILDTERGRSMSYRAEWVPVKQGFRSERDCTSLTTAAKELTGMLAKLSTYETVGAVRRERRSSRRDFIEHWNRALIQQRNRIERGELALEYSSLVEDEGYLQFTLSEPPPDNLDWEDDKPLAVRSSSQSLLPVGTLVEIRGHVVVVAKQTRQPGSDNSYVPRTGKLTVNVMEALTANTRQQQAVNAFLYEQMANPKLATVIIDPANATRISDTDLDFFQDWLSDDKKDAVRKAVSSNELFLIQGPPGTGKTSVIAEIVLQILKQNPESRILLTSQSNVAVDHALTQIAKAAGDSQPEMVRVGRGEKIGSGGERWTLDERARSWRREVLDKCDPVIEKLRQSEKRIRADIRATGAPPDSESTDADTIEEWIEEAKALAGQLHEYDQEYAELGSDAHAEVKAEAAEMVNRTRTQLRGQLSSLNELLAEPVDMQSNENEAAALLAIVEAASHSVINKRNADDPAQQELHRTLELRKILTQWRGVVGLTADFKELIAKSARVAAATCLFSANLFRGGRNSGEHVSNTNIDWAIVDEAGRATVPEILVPIVRAERTILVGDERQLPPMVDEMIMREIKDLPDDHNFDSSLFQSLVEQIDGTASEYATSLRTQYRMHPAIGNLVSSVFYEGKLENGERAHSRGSKFDLMPAPVTWLSTSSMPRQFETRSGESYANRTEADVVHQLLDKMESKHQGREKPSVGVITGYSAQVERLTTQIDPENGDKWRNLEIEIATVDSFQGRECDAVVYSTVRSNRNRTIGFLRDYRRINVALSRARDLLVIVGDHRMMEEARVGSESNPFASVLEHIRSHESECSVIKAELVQML